MKAIRVHQFGGPEVLTLDEVPTPAPGEGQVLVRLSAIGVNPVDTYIRAGKYGPRAFPYTPGTDGGGVVESVGPGVSAIHPGDRVYVQGTLSGAYAQYALCAAAQVHPLPTEVTFAQGAAIGVPYVTAHRALFHRARPEAGETVLIHGASGSVGMAAVQFARPFGLNVIGTAGTDEGRRLVAQQGAHHVLDHHNPDHLQQAMKLTDGRGLNIILEMSAHTNLASDLTILARNGRVIVVGSRGPIEITPREIMGRNADIRGMTIMTMTEPELKGVHAAIAAGLESKILRPIVSKEFPVDQAGKAHEAVLAPGSLGKIVLVP